MRPRRLYHVLATGTLWEELVGEPDRPRRDLRFIAAFDDQRAAIAEARRRASLDAPATIYVMSADGSRAEVIQIEVGP